MEMVGEDLRLIVGGVRVCVVVCVCVCRLKTPPERQSVTNVFLRTYCFCEEVGVVKGVHLLSGEVRSVTTALKVVEEVQEEVQEN